ncbi:ATP12 family protein [Henriciella sp.]|uniref:ATP12 family chaperone protein n=1 Tax=Henriciella sp. TaxID=1968823 RepID=UPI0026211E68|nr:ATP12 family protein [Henriciella sp.]
MSNTSPNRQDLPRRFYKTVSVVESDGGWRIELDGRPVKTPAKAELSLPNETLARHTADEWEAQGEHIDPTAMPITRLANVAIDRTPHTREELAQEVAKYTTTDLVCHLAEGPTELRERQEEKWRPLRDWAGRSLGIVLLPVEGVIASPQPDASTEAARLHALSLDDFRLTALVWATGLYGSAVLALAVEQGEIDADDAFERSRIDEAWQIEQWGEDAEARQATEARRADARALGKLFSAFAR